MNLIKNDIAHSGEFELRYLIENSYTYPDDFVDVDIDLLNKTYAITTSDEVLNDEFGDSTEICEAYLTPEESIQIAQKMQKAFNLYSIGPGWFSITAANKHDTYYNYLNALQEAVDKLESKEKTALAKKFKLSRREFLEMFRVYYKKLNEEDDTIFCEQFNNEKGYWLKAYLKWEDGKKELKNLIEEELERN